MTSDRWIDKFNEYNKTFDIYRTIIITRKREEIYDSLMIEEYDVFDKNADVYDFIESNKRILLINLDDFRDYSIEMLHVIRGEHNFIIVDNEFSDEVLTTLKNVKNTTLKENYYIWII